MARFIDGMAKPLAMQKDGQGVWSATTELPAPDYYTTHFRLTG
jgi:hypothetical protein